MKSRKRFLVHTARRGGIIWYSLHAVCAWCQSLLSPLGLAHVLAMACLGAQVVLINVFLVRYLSRTVLLTLIVDVPLFVHLAWFWRPESARRAAPTQWFSYCWVHAAKVVVLFCRVMPRLPSNSASEDVLRGSDFAINRAYFENFFSPTMLANLLLITPVFYALLMIRTSKAIFGSLSKRVTVDLIMHYDMLWHVVLDMVDQVDMFYYARLAEWVGREALENHRQNLVQIQTAVPCLLFFSIVLQAQAFPGVVTDRWTIPEERDSALPTQARLQVAASRSETFCQTSRHSSVVQRSLLPSFATAPPLPRLPSSSQAGAQRPSLASGQRQDQSPGEPPPPPMPETARLSVTFASGGIVSGGSSSTLVSDRRSTQSSTVGQKMSSQSIKRDEHLQDERIRRKQLQGVIQLIWQQSVILARKRSAMVSLWVVDIPFLFIRVWLWHLLRHTYFPGLGIKNGICIALNLMQYTLVALASNESFRKIKKDLADYIARFHRAGLQEFSSEGRSLEPSPELPAASASGGETGETGIVLALATPSEAAASTSVASTPVQQNQRHTEARKQKALLQKALRRVGRETARSTSVCAYMCALIISCLAGFVLAKGESFVHRLFTEPEMPIELFRGGP